MGSLFKDNRFFERFKQRRFHVAILTVFLLVLFAYSFTMTWYIYRQDKQVVIEFSDTLMKQVSHESIERINTLLKNIQKLSENEESLVNKAGDVSLSNSSLIAYMINAIKSIPDLTILHIATDEGSWLGVFSLLPNATFRNDPTKPLPKDYKIAIQFIDRSGDEPKETWIYKNEKGLTLAAEEVKAITYDPRSRPWFRGAVSKKETYWSPVYNFVITNHPGISIGYPLYNKKGDLIAVAGGDIELRFMAHYLSRQKVGNTGKTAILTGEGKTIASSHFAPEQSSQLLPITEVDKALGKAYHLYSTTKKESFLFTNQGVEYLASIVPYTAPSNEKWLIAIIVPSTDFLSKVLETQKHLYFISLLIITLASLLIAYFSKRISKPIVLLSEEVNKIKHLDLEGEIPVRTSIKEIYQMKLAISAMKSALKSFGRYVPQGIVKELMEQGKEIKLGGERKEITVFFSDIYDFTSISEVIPIEKLMPQLSIYYETLSRIIIASSGTIDKYMGDGVMAIWGAPTSLSHHPFVACRSALLCQKSLKALNETWEKEGKPKFLTRIGLHMGSAIVGNIGTPERMNYTVMGDMVNVASRLEGMNKNYKTQIIVSEEIYSTVKEHFLMRPLDIVAVKGKAQESKIYELLGEFEGGSALMPTPEVIELCRSFEKAFSLFQNHQIAEAKELLTVLSAQYPNDYVIQMYLERCKN